MFPQRPVEKSNPLSFKLLVLLLLVSTFLTGVVISSIKNTDASVGAAWWATAKPKPSSCKNTAVGKSYVTDEEGQLCLWEQIDPSTHCCNKRLHTLATATAESGTAAAKQLLSVSSLPTFSRFTCEACDKPSNCCSIYEFCVSCCMNPDNYELLVEKSESDESFKHFNVHSMDSFDICTTACRTSSRSIVTKQENTFKSEYKYCFGLDPPPSQELLDSRKDIAETKLKLEETLVKAKECRQRGDCAPPAPALSAATGQNSPVSAEVVGEDIQERRKSGVFIEVDPFTPHYQQAQRFTSESSAARPFSKSLTLLVALMTALLASLTVHAFKPL